MSTHRKTFPKSEAASILRSVDFGSSVAEQDDLLETARVETSVFADLLADRVDIVPGTKGSGKSALYRIFVDFLSGTMLQHRRVVVAHGVQSHGDSVFHAFSDRFAQLSESAFVDFWCIYLVSLAREQFIKSELYQPALSDAGSEIARFEAACFAARIPDSAGRRGLRDVLDWALNALKGLRPKLSASSPEGYRVDLTLFGDSPEDHTTQVDDDDPQIPRYLGDIKETLEAVLAKADLSLWLMVDRLDEIFPRRSDVETRALRGLLRTLRVFDTGRIRVKVFLRDDIFRQITSVKEGFAALTHVTARQADTLRWSEESILTLIVKRLYTSSRLCEALAVDADRLAASRDYREEAFYKVFPATVHTPPNQSGTLRWIYSHSSDGLGVVTPRDVIDLLTRARQFQYDEFSQDPAGSTDVLISSAAIRHGLREMSKRKRDNVLQAEFPHLWPHIAKLQGGHTAYSAVALERILGAGSRAIVQDFIAIGLLATERRGSQMIYKVPFLYREGLELSQGLQE